MALDPHPDREPGMDARIVVAADCHEGRHGGPPVIVVGLDLSLTGTGLAAIQRGQITTPPVQTRLLTSKPAGDDVAARAHRLTDLAGAIVAWCEGADLVCIERPAYSSNSGSVTDRAGLWWLVCARLVRGHKTPVVDIVNNHLKTYATGKGNAGKDAVLAETVRRYGDLVPTLADNNEADALQLAALGWHHLTGTPLVDLPATHTRAVAAVKWPPARPCSVSSSWRTLLGMEPDPTPAADAVTDPAPGTPPPAPDAEGPPAAPGDEPTTDTGPGEDTTAAPATTGEDDDGFDASDNEGDDLDPDDAKVATSDPEPTPNPYVDGVSQDLP